METLKLSDDALFALFTSMSTPTNPHQAHIYLQAFSHFKRIALDTSDFGYSFYALGKAYEAGLGVAKDLQKAKGLYTEAIKRYQTYEGQEESHLEAIRALEKWL
ncbi:SEL1-like repeat protein [Helicobacter cynogastricus]|uniref:SEL1-like repeat protein n=1 Tax=Helicobacter cynogastricus TaxID=329937 RepID=UPI000CF18E07|nr:SEL1-like repeat protein [Helicobacter cynogastricus]